MEQFDAFVKGAIEDKSVAPSDESPAEEAGGDSDTVETAGSDEEGAEVDAQGSAETETEEVEEEDDSLKRLLSAEKERDELKQKLSAYEKSPPKKYDHSEFSDELYDVDDPFEYLADRGVDAELLFDKMILAKEKENAKPEFKTKVLEKVLSGRRESEKRRAQKEVEKREFDSRVQQETETYKGKLVDGIGKSDLLKKLNDADSEWLMRQLWIEAHDHYSKGEAIEPDALLQKFEAAMKKRIPIAAEPKKAPATNPLLSGKKSPPRKKQVSSMQEFDEFVKQSLGK